MARVIALLLCLAASTAQAAGIPRECVKYRRDLVRNARQIFGMQAPTATLGAQMAQESACKADARSAFASGLTQFTPDTASWISGRYQDLASNQPTNPVWAIRAQARYMHHLIGRAGGATPCDSTWFALWGYNGGEGWVRRDRKLAAAAGFESNRHHQVEPFNAGRAPAMFRENRTYPKRIIDYWQPRFVAAGWGAGSCV